MGAALIGWLLVLALPAAAFFASGAAEDATRAWMGRLDALEEELRKARAELTQARAELTRVRR